MRGLSGPGRLAVAVTALACAVTVAGCASSSSSGGGPPATPATPTAPATSGSAPSSAPASSQSPRVVTSPSPCPNGSLQVKQGVAQGYAGGVYQVIDFTNISGSTCTLTGYPGVSLVSGPSNAQIGLAAEQSTATPVRQVTLAPGETANALLQIVNALNYPSASCGPTMASALKVYPPNQTAPVFLPNTSNGCSKPVRIMYVGAVQPGSGSS